VEKEVKGGRHAAVDGFVDFALKCTLYGEKNEQVRVGVGNDDIGQMGVLGGHHRRRPGKQPAEQENKEAAVVS
jgi:hypothetical protein